MAWVYLLQCKDGTLYTGSTTDLERRLREHNSSGLGAKYTAARQPVRLEQAWEVGDWSSALRLEQRIKKLRRPQKLELINDPQGIVPLAAALNLELIGVHPKTGNKQERGEESERNE